MRAFLGIPIAQDILPKIARVQQKISDFDIKFVEKENFHFNIKFFREIDDKKVDQLKEIVSETCSKLEKFDTNISGVSAFPSEKYIRVIWLGVRDGYNELVTLANMINNNIERLGFEREKQKFIPHLTLGRVRSGRNKEKMIATLKEIKDIEIGKTRVDRIVLFQSKLSPKGPTYEEVFSVELP